LQVSHDRYLAPAGSGRVSHHLCAGHMILCFAMREIQSHHIDAGGDHPLQRIESAGSRADSSNDLGGALFHDDPV